MTKAEFKEKIKVVMAGIQKEESCSTLITEGFLLDNGFTKVTDAKLYNVENQTFFVREFEDNFQLIVKEESTGKYSLVIPSGIPDGFTYEHLSFVNNLEKLLNAVKK